jgi:hypothetical protein
MPSRPVLNTSVDMLDEVAALIEEAARLEPLSPEERAMLGARLRRIRAGLAPSRPRAAGRAA